MPRKKVQAARPMPRLVRFTRQSASYLERQLRRSHNVLAASLDVRQRMAARRRINIVIDQLAALEPIRPMKRGLAVDKQSAGLRAITTTRIARTAPARRSTTALALAAAMAAGAER